MSSQSSHDRLVLQYLALAIKGYDLEGYRDTSLRKTHERLNSTGAKAYRCARATVFGAVPMGGMLHTRHTARSHARRCIEAYRLDAFNCPEIEDDGFDYRIAADAFNRAFTKSATEEIVDFNLDSIPDSTLEAALDSVISEALSPIPFVGSAIAAARIPKAMKRVLNVAHQQAEKVHTSAIKTARPRIEAYRLALKSTQAYQGANLLATNAPRVNQGASQPVTNASRVNRRVGQLINYASRVNQKAGQLITNASQANQKAGQLINYASRANQGADQLINFALRINKGVDNLINYAPRFNQGASQLASKTPYSPSFNFFWPFMVLLFICIVYFINSTWLCSTDLSHSHSHTNI